MLLFLSQNLRIYAEITNQLFEHNLNFLGSNWLFCLSLNMVMTLHNFLKGNLVIIYLIFYYITTYPLRIYHQSMDKVHSFTYENTDTWIIIGFLSRAPVILCMAQFFLVLRLSNMNEWHPINARRPSNHYWQSKVHISNACFSLKSTYTHTSPKQNRQPIHFQWYNFNDRNTKDRLVCKYYH